ncbi:discoidin domain-containing protein [Catenulispora yoronensis]
MSPLGEFALDRTGWTATASASAGTAGAALDGDATTGWSSGAAQAGGEWLQVDLGAPTQLDRVYVDAAANAGQYPAAYQVAVSSDGTTWSTVTSGAATAQRQSIAFPPRVARYLRVTQTGTGASPWTVAEINAFNDPVLTYAPSCLTAGNQVSGQTCVLDLGAQTSVWKVLFDAGAATPASSRPSTRSGAPRTTPPGRSTPTASAPARSPPPRCPPRRPSAT